MLSPDKEMEGLREQWEQLSSSISRLVVARLSILFIFVATFQHSTESAMVPRVGMGYRAILLPPLPFEVPLLGSRVPVDLRNWIYPLAFILIISEVYRLLLREKLKMLDALAAHLQMGNKDKSSVVDSLFFSSSPDRSTYFASYPRKLADGACTVGFWALVLFGVVLGGEFWRNWPIAVHIGICVPLITASFYALAYYNYVSKRLETETSKVIKAEFPQRTAWRPGGNWIDALWKEIVRAFYFVLNKINAKVLLFVAASVTLTASYLHRGTYSKLLGYLLFRIRLSVDYFFQIPEAIVSFLTVALAILILVRLLVSLFSSQIWHQKRLNRWLFMSAGAFSIYRMSNFGFVYSLPFPEVLQTAIDLVLSNISWLFGIGLWYYFSFSHSNERRKRWPDIRSFLIVLYAPLAVYVTCWYAYFALKVDWFAITILVANHLLALGLLKLSRDDQADPASIRVSA